MPRALAASVQAGRDAVAAFAPAEARRHLERALEMWWSLPDAEKWAGTDQADLLTLAARACSHSGDMPRALSLYQQALKVLDPDTDPERAALIIDQRSYTHRMQGEDGAGTQELETALTWLPDQPSPVWATVLASLAGSLLRL